MLASEQKPDFTSVFTAHSKGHAEVRCVCDLMRQVIGLHSVCLSVFVV